MREFFEFLPYLDTIESPSILKNRKNPRLARDWGVYTNKKPCARIVLVESNNSIESQGALYG